MASKILFECWCIFFTKLVIYENRVELRKFFGLSTSTIPMSKIASVHKKINGVGFETTGGRTSNLVQPWKANLRHEVEEIVLDLIEKQDKKR